MDFTVTYADAADRRIVHSEVIEVIDAHDLDVAAAKAINNCPSEWFVVRVEQTDIFPTDHGAALMDATFSVLP
ncbi:MAG TPA: hypothetical protein VKA83_05000 [Methylomirabilota bacterium]|nr:hypothetical protein [Methylomirabilota bacterium]